MSPERIVPQEFGLKDGRPTESSDCYSLGMVIYETISGKPPFHEHRDITVSVKVLKGEYPPRRPEFSESLWKLLEMCWAFQPNKRPSIGDVLQCLVMVSIPLETPHSGAREKMEKGSDDWNKSAKGFSSVPKEMSGMTTENITTTSFDPSYATDTPPREAPVIDVS